MQFIVNYRGKTTKATTIPVYIIRSIYLCDKYKFEAPLQHNKHGIVRKKNNSEYEANFEVKSHN